MNKKFILTASVILLLGLLIRSAVLAATPITITLQPQNQTFPEHASASWSVEADGENLSYEWFIVYKGVAYNTKNSFAENHPWQEGIVGDGYGCSEAGNAFYINGIGAALNGAEIYCVVSDGTYSVTSSAAYITVGAAASPPRIVVPASVSIEKDTILKLSCRAEAPDGDSIDSYLWYETTTGQLRDISAIGAKEGYEENYSILVCDTTQVGTRYYVCAVGTEKGGFAYSSVIAVTVTDSQTTTTGSHETEVPPESIPPQDTGATPPESNPRQDTAPVSTDGLTTETASGLPDSDKTSGKKDTNDETRHESGDQGISLPVVLVIALGAAVVAGGTVAAIMTRKKSDKDK